MKRLFIALEVPENLKSEVVVWKDKHYSLPVRWIPSSDLHITIVPPWDEEDPEGVIEKLDTIQGKTGSIRVSFDRVSIGPNRRFPRLIWATGEVPQRMLVLRELIKNTLSKISDRNVFFTHLTMGRFEEKDLEKFPGQRLSEDVDWLCFSESILLMETKIGDSGVPEYEILKKVTI